MRERERRTGGRRKRTSRSRHLKALPIRNQWMLQILNMSEKQTIFFGRPDNRFKGPHCFKKEPKMKPLPMSKTQMTPSPTELHYRTCRELYLSCSAFPPLERVPHRPVLPRAPVPGHRGRVESLCGNCLAGPSAEDSAKRAGMEEEAEQCWDFPVMCW